MQERSVGLDIVRALAILMVLASHYGTYFTAWYGTNLLFQIAAAGFFGVELFFVLSGFLIGRLLIDILDRDITPRAWLTFMSRRWLRTLPLYFLCLLLLTLTWSPQFWPHHHRILWQVLPWFVTLTQNFAWGTVAGWFAVSWSLSVEEWFYLLFSALLFLAARLAGKRTAMWASLLLFLVVPAALRWRLPPDVNWNEVTSKAVIYRLDAIAVGVAVAWMQARHFVLMRFPRTLLCIGVLIIGLFWAGVLDRLLRPSLHVRETFMFDVASLGFALWLPAAASTRWRPHRWLAAAARAISQQSYAMYLTHLTLIEIINFYRPRLHLPIAGTIALTLALLYGLTYLSFRYIEKPILALRPPQNPAG